tara:strand:- start:158 stop:436 length:279 start_codon:yes stop_codon:yes gene_type:complete
MHKLLLNTILIIYPLNLFADQPKDWQLGFQKAASGHMEDLVWFHDYMLLPIITAITAFVLFLVIYACIRYRQLEIPLHLKLVTILLLKLFGQ